MSKVILTIFYTLIILLITFNILSAFNISFFGFRIFRVGSGSMIPYLEINDIVITKKTNEYEENDVITFKEEDQYITHRIVQINGETIITKGDANNTNDKPIKKGVIVGRIILKITGLGFIIYLFSNPIAWILLFVIGLIIIFFSTDNKKGKRYR